MQTTEQIAVALGRKAMAKALGVGAAAISKEVLSGDFPAGWYFVVKEMCDERGIECPRELFNFKTPSVGPKVSACNAEVFTHVADQFPQTRGRKVGAS